MKVFIFLSLLLNATYLSGQENILKDSLIKEISLSRTSGDTTIWYRDYKDRNDLPPSIVDKNGKTVEYIIQSVNSRAKIDKMMNVIFMNEEVQEMKGRGFYIQFLAFPSGEVYSTSFLFLHGDPQVDVDKLVEFSNQLKKNTSLTIQFDRDVEQKGLVGWAYRVFSFLE